jgi:hypothetical protein
LTDVLGRRRAVLEVIVIAAFVAFAINVAASLVVHAAGYGWTTRAIATGCGGLGLVFLLASLARVRHRQIDVDGFVAYNASTKELVRVTRYGLADSVAAYVNALCSEDKGIKGRWIKESLQPLISAAKGGRVEALGDARAKSAFSLELLREATEYFCVSLTSRELRHYFKDPRFREKRLVVLERDDVPDFLLSNHFVDRFSKQPRERAPFQRNDAQELRDPDSGVLYGKGGALYEKFRLLLPAGATLTRRSRVEQGSHSRVLRRPNMARRFKPYTADADAVVLKTPKFDLFVEVLADGINTPAPPEFETLFLDGQPSGNLRLFAIHVRVTVGFRFGTLLTPGGLAYYRWLDALLSAITRSVDADAFYEEVGWPLAQTIAKITRPPDSDATSTFEAPETKVARLRS